MSALLRNLLIEQLDGKNAHVSFKNAVKGMTAEQAGIRPDKLPYSIWEQVEHIRIAQSDILKYCTDPGYEAPSWPDEYWPSRSEPAGEKEWRRSIETILSETEQMADLVRDEENDLFKPFPHAENRKHTLFREALLVIDHNSYHTGQIVTIRRQLGLWSR